MDGYNQDVGGARRRWLLIGGASGLGIVLALLLAAHTPPVRSRAFGWIARYLDSRLNLILAADDLSYNLLTGTVRLTNVRLAARGHEAEPFFTADRVGANVPLRTYTGRLILDDVAVTNGRVVMRTDANGVSNLPPGAGGPPPATPRHLTLRGLHINGLDYRYDNEVNGLHVAVTGVDTALEHVATSEFDGAEGPLSIRGGIDVQWGERTLRIDPVASRMAFEGHVVSLIDVPLATSMGPLFVSGRVVRVLDSTSLELQYRGDVDVARAATWFPPPMTVAGTARVNGAVYGPLGGIAVSARFDAQALAVGNERDLTVSGSLLLEADRRLRLDRVLVSPASGGQVDAVLDLPPDDDAPLVTSATFQGVDARVFLRTVETAVPAVATRLDGEARYEGGAAPRLTARADATPIRENGATPLGGRVRMQVAGGRWTLDHDLQSDGVTAAGAAQGAWNWNAVNRSTLEGATHVGIASLAAADRALAPHDLRVPASVREQAGSFDADVRLRGTLGDPAADITARSTTFDVPGIGPATVDAVIAADRSAIVVSPATVTRGQTAANGAVTIDLVARTMDGRFTATVGDVTELQSSVPEAWRLNGALSAEAVIAGSTAAPTVDVTVTAPELTLAGEALRALDVRAFVTENGIDVRELRVEQGEGTLAARGRYGFDGTHEVTVDANRLSWHGVLAGESETRATVSGQITSGGDVNAPSGDGRLTFALTGGVAGDLVGEGTIDLALNQDHARVNALIPALGAFANGTIRLSAPYDYRAVAVLNRVNLATVAPLMAALPDQIAGQLSLTAAVVGQAQGDEPVSVEANLQHVDAMVAGLPLTLAQPTAISWRQGELDVRDFTAQLGSSQITAFGTWAGRDDTVINAAYRGEIADALTAARAFDADPGIVARGRVTAEVFATARPGDLIASVEVSEAYVEAADGVVLTGVAASAGLTGDVFTLDSLSGNLDAVRAKGGFAARGRARLPDLNPRRATGEFTIDQTAIDAAGVEVTQTRPSAFSITNGIVSMDDVIWEAAGSRIVVGGNVDVSRGEPALNLRLDGTAVLRVLSAFAPSVGFDGNADVEIYIGGTPSAPSLSGGITLADVEIGLTSPRVVVSAISGPIRLDHDRIELRGLTGTANGGLLVVDGGVVLSGVTIGEGKVYLQTQGLALEYPRGLRSEVDALLTLEVGGVTPVIRGDVRVQRSAYTDPISLAALARANAASGVRPNAESFIDDIRLDVAVTTVEDIRVDNNYGRFDTAAQLRVVGTVGQPGMSGRATLREGGTVYAAGRTFTLTRGTISFTNLSRVEPDLDIQAETRVGGQGTVTMTLQGTPDRFSFDLSSESGGSQEEIATALFGGAVSGANAVTLLSSDLLGVTGRQLGLDALRLDRGDVVRDEFREDPSQLLQDSTDLVTRLTLSKRLYDNVEFLISQNLRQNGKTTFVISYYPLPALELRAISRDDATLGLGLRHEIILGGRRVTTGAAARPEVRVSAVQFAGDTAPVTEEELRDRARLKAGSRFDFYAWQRDLDNLTALLVERGYVEARVRGERREVDASTVEITYRVTRGPATQIVVQGIDLPRNEIDGIRQMWSRAVFDRFVVEDAEERVERYLLTAGLLSSTVSGSLQTSGDIKTLQLVVTPGPANGSRRFVFQGNAARSNSQLETVITEAGLEVEGWIDRDRLAETLLTHYRNLGYLDATVRVEDAVVSDNVASLPIVITEGGRAVIGGVYWNGVDESRQPMLERIASIETGEPYALDDVNVARERIERRYRSLGFNSAEVAVTAAPGDTAGTVNVAFTVTEGARQILREVITSGTTRTRDGVIRRALRLTIGEPVNLDEWARARKRLYDTNVFRTVDIQAVPVGDVVDGDQQVQAQVTVEEYPPWRLRYGVQVDRERRDAGEDGALDVTTGVLGEIRNQNLFGRALTAGAAARLERDYQRVNTFLQNSTFFGLPIRSGVFATMSREDIRFDGNVISSIDIRSLSFEQRWRRRRALEMTYGYRFERNQTTFPSHDVGDNDPLNANIGRLSAAAFYDRRDDPVNGTRGTFTSLSIEQGLRALGSDTRYGKVFAQQQAFLTIGPAVLASRVLIGRGYGRDDLVTSDRFFAGGATTVRGYAENGLGPRNILGDPKGGNQLLIANQELRLPVYGWVRAVGFLDIGNAFDDDAPFAWKELKVGYGVGIRLASPVGLLRLDFGIPGSTSPFSTRRANDFNSGRWYFGLGHIF